jgi:hypothetical protein
MIQKFNDSLQMFAAELLKTGVEQAQKPHFHLIFLAEQPRTFAELNKWNRLNADVVFL